jgi:carboxymethylenebutenolidase
MRFSAAFWISCVLAFVAGGCGFEKAQTSPVQLAPGVWGVLESPDDPGPHPGVVLLHGAIGWRPELVDLASAFADSGLVALTIDYYAETARTPSGSFGKLEAWPGYQAAVQKAVEYLQSLPSVSGRPVGLVGFSRGAFLAVSVASSVPGVGAVVDFYGGGGGGRTSLEEDAQDLPPVLILHGDADNVVPVSYAYALRDAVVASGGEAELHVYPGAGHSFNAPFSPAYSAKAADDSHRRAIEFLRRRLVSGPAESAGAN